MKLVVSCHHNEVVSVESTNESVFNAFPEKVDIGRTWVPVRHRLLDTLQYITY